MLWKRKKDMSDEELQERKKEKEEHLKYHSENSRRYAKEFERPGSLNKPTAAIGFPLNKLAEWEIKKELKQVNEEIDRRKNEKSSRKRKKS